MDSQHQCCTVSNCSHVNNYDYCLHCLTERPVQGTCVKYIFDYGLLIAVQTECTGKWYMQYMNERVEASSTP